MRIVPALHGWLWIRDAIRIFAKRPLSWMLFVMIYWLALTVVSVVPILGMVIGLAVIPAFSVSFMNIARDIEGGATPTPLALVSGFRRNTKAVWTLGGIYFAACVAVIGLTTLLDDGVMLGALRGQRPRVDIESSIFIAAMFYAPVMVAFWFAPLLAARQNMGAVKSLFYSFVATSRNWRAMLFYGAMLGALIMIIGVLLVAAVRVFGAGTIGASEVSPGASMFGLIATPIILALSSVLFASWYTSYQDVFGADPSGAPEAGAQ
jgi:hypothetical protein